jgi:hypothetical protein
MRPLTELDAFFTEHRAGGELDAGVDEPIVWIVSNCAGRGWPGELTGGDRATAG